MSLDLLGRRLVFVLVSVWLRLGRLRCSFPGWLGWWRWRFGRRDRPRDSRLEEEAMTRVGVSFLLPLQAAQVEALEIQFLVPFHRCRRGGNHAALAAVEEAAPPYVERSKHPLRTRPIRVD